MSETKAMQRQGLLGNKKDRTLRMVQMAMLIAISSILVFVSFPIIPGATFLEYDMADIPVLLAAFTMGTPAGMFVLTAAAFIQAFLFGHNGWVGFLMHVVSSGTFVLVASAVYRALQRSNKGMIIGLLCGCVIKVLIMIPLNFIFTPKMLMDVSIVEAASIFWHGLFGGYDAAAYQGATVSAYQTVKGLLLVGLIPFNLLKAALNSVLFYLLYRHLPSLVKKIK